MPTQVPLTVGTPVTGLAGTAGDSFYFTLAVQAGHAYSLTLTDTDASGADADLTYALDRAFEYGDEDGGSYNGDANETVTFSADTDGTLYVVVYGYAGTFDALSLEATPAAYVPQGAAAALTVNASTEVALVELPTNAEVRVMPDGTWYAFAQLNTQRTWLYTSPDGRAWTRRGSIAAAVYDVFAGNGRFFIEYWTGSAHGLYETTDFVTLTPRTHPSPGSAKVLLAELGGQLFALDTGTGTMYVSATSGASWAGSATDLPAFGMATYAGLRAVAGKLVLLGGQYGGTNEPRTYVSSNGTAWTQVAGFVSGYSDVALCCVRGGTVFGFVPSGTGTNAHLAALDVATGAITSYTEMVVLYVGIVRAAATNVVIQNGAFLGGTFVDLVRSDAGTWSVLPKSLFSQNAQRMMCSPTRDDVMHVAWLDYQTGVLGGNAHIAPIAQPMQRTMLTFATAAVVPPVFVDDHYAYVVSAQAVWRCDRKTGHYLDSYQAGFYAGIVHVGAGVFVIVDAQAGTCTTYDGPTGTVSVATASGITRTDLNGLLYTGEAFVLFARSSTTIFDVNVSRDGRVWQDATAAFNVATAGSGWQTGLRCEQGRVYYYNGVTAALRVIDEDFGGGVEVACPTWQVGYNRHTNRVAYFDGGLKTFDLATPGVVTAYRPPAGLDALETYGARPTPLGDGFALFVSLTAYQVTLGFVTTGALWRSTTLELPDRYVDPAGAREVGGTGLVMQMGPLGAGVMDAPDAAPRALRTFDFVLFWTGFIGCGEAF